MHTLIISNKHDNINYTFISKFNLFFIMYFFAEIMVNKKT